MANLNQSLKEAVCIDEEVFFGPITDKEKKIREQFEIFHRNELKVVDETVEDDESQSHSVYKSFSVDESKYDSFDDSLNEEIDKMPQEAKPITLRKSYDKIKSKRSGFYDSLEDVCSLVSNIDKCSISCEVENESNVNSKHFVEDSLKIPSMPVVNKNNFKNDQVHFDDDSLAIIECEATFSDSLEEVNVLESIEIEEINDIENITMENQNIVLTVDQKSAYPPKNLFDTSVEIVCEKMKDSDTADQEESFDEKNLLYDSLSNSDFKEILADSLEEDEQLIKMLSKHLTTNVTHEKENVMDNQSILFNVEHNSVHPSPNLYDTSVQIVSEKDKDNSGTSPKESFNDKNICDSFSNSEIKDISKDSLEEAGKSNEILNIFQQRTNDNIEKTEYVYPNQNALETSVQIVYPNLYDTSVQIVSEKDKDYSSTSPKESFNDKNVPDSFSNSKIKDISKDSLEESGKSNEILNIFQQRTKDNIKKTDYVYPNQNALETSVQIVYDNLPISFEKESAHKKTCNAQENLENYKSLQKTYSEQIKTKTGSKQSSTSKTTYPLKNSSENLKNIDTDKNTLLLDLDVNEDKMAPDISAVTDDSAITISASDISNIEKKTFSVESCHLKILNDDINIDKDLKLELHMEVTVGDKKCQIASQDIKIVPVTSQSSKSEIDFISTVSVAKPLSNAVSSTTFEKSEQVIDLNNSELNLKIDDSHIFRAHPSSEINSSSHKKSETEFTPNITRRAKSSTSQISCSKLSCTDFFNNVSLLEALDLPDLSASFLNESVIQSKDSLISLNLYSPDECIQKFHIPQFKNQYKNKENIPEHMQGFGNENCAKRKSVSPNKVCNSKTPQSLHKCSSFKETNKKTPGTKIPVRKFYNFAVPASTPSKLTKPVPATLSAEKVKKCQHSPHSVDSGKKTPGATPNKIPHICKVRNTIFSKVPQIIPSKKYMNVQSPVAQYIKNNNGPVKAPVIDPVLRDCMNRMMESPHHLHHAPASGSVKSSKKKA